MYPFFTIIRVSSSGGDNSLLWIVHKNCQSEVLGLGSMERRALLLLVMQRRQRRVRAP